MIIIIIIIINYRTLVINSAFIISHCHHQNALDVIACYWTDHLNRWSVPIGCCWITPRLKFSGAHHHVDNIRSHPVRSALAPSLFDPRLQGIHRRWHDHEDPHHSRRQSVLHRSTTDPERAAISLTSCLADLGSCTGCHQGGLLQLGSRWYLWYAARPVAVRLECRRPFGFLSEAVRMHNPIASWAPLVASFGASHIAAVRSGLPLSSWNSANVPCWGLLRTSDVDTRRRLRSSDTAMLVVLSTRRLTLGDCAFPVASARAWNSLSSFVRSAPSLTTFRRELKTVLFRSSFDND